MKRGLRALVLGSAASLALIAVIVAATSEHSDPSRCPDGLVSGGPHCCGQGQHYASERCLGPALRCSKAQHVVNGNCLPEAEAIELSGGRLEITVDDWDLQSRGVVPEAQDVAPFRLDRFEVTRAQWAECVVQHGCREIGQAPDALPVTAISAEDAAAYCTQQHGRLPHSAEWLWAARGKEGRRYPWGAFGLVCRRAVFGLVAGPCASAATGPEVPGSRPDGATPDGIEDLAGNVAEWTQDSASEIAARGGSYRSTLAAELKALAVSTRTAPADDIGFRCAYASTAQ